MRIISWVLGIGLLAGVVCAGAYYLTRDVAVTGSETEPPASLGVETEAEAASSMQDVNEDILQTSDEATYQALASGEYEAAISEAKIALEFTKSQFEPASPERRLASQNLALLYEASGVPEDAVALMQESLAEYETAENVEQDVLLALRDGLAAAYTSNEQADKALEIYELNAVAYAELVGPNHEMTRGTQFKKALSLERLGDLDGAAAILPTLYDLETGELDTIALSAANVMASLYEGAGQIDEAIAVYEQISALPNKQSVAGGDEPQIDYSANLERLRGVKATIEEQPEISFTPPSDEDLDQAAPEN